MLLQRKLPLVLCYDQRCGSLTFWCGSDPDPWIHASEYWIRILLFSSLTVKMPTKNYFKKNSASYFLKVHLHHFSKIKSQKESQNSTGRNQGFSYYFCMMIEGSGSGSRFGSIPLTNGFGSGRPKKCGSGGSESVCGSIRNTGYDAVKVKMLQISLYILIFLLTVLYNFGCVYIFVWLWKLLLLKCCGN